MNFTVLLHPRAARFLERLEEPLKARIKKRMKELKDAPQEKGERLIHSPFWKIRVEDYRVIYEIDRSQRRIVILFIGHRRNVYDDFSRLT